MCIGMWPPAIRLTRPMRPSRAWCRALRWMESCAKRWHRCCMAFSYTSCTNFVLWEKERMRELLWTLRLCGPLWPDWATYTTMGSSQI